MDGESEDAYRSQHKSLHAFSHTNVRALCKLQDTWLSGFINCLRCRDHRMHMFFSALTLSRPLLPYWYSYKASYARPG